MGFNQKNVLKFLDELAPLAYKALRADLHICHEKHEEPGLTHAMSVELAKEKGGRLCTAEEIVEFIMGGVIYPKEDQLVACFDKNGEKEWIQVGNKWHKPGKQHVAQFGSYPVW